MSEWKAQSRLPWVLALVMLITGAMAGCGEDEMAAKDREATINGLLALVEEGPVGATIRLDSVTDFEWDEVYRFANGVSTERIKDVVGTDVTLDSSVKNALTSDSSLLIFAKNDAVVYQLAVGPGIERPTLTINGPSGKVYTPDTALLEIEYHDPSGGHGSLMFKE